MNERLAYEELIAAKLEQLAPLPAMADAIWSRISDELDREMPTDDGGAPDGGGGSALPGTGGFAWPGLGLIILAAAGLLYWNTRPKQNNTTTPSMPATSVQSSPVANDTSPPENTLPYKDELTPASRQQLNANGSLQDTASVNDVNISSLDKLQPDTAASRPMPLINQPAPGLQQPDLVPNEKPAAQTNVDTPPAKKSRGVTGINNSDYRIVPDRKDTTKRKNDF